jgi:hypothetical protein
MKKQIVQASTVPYTQMKKQSVQASTVVLYETWHRIRKPFLIPPNVTTHDCTECWEKFDIDKAGCVECGNYHLCEQGDCEYTMTQDSLVCSITGLCVKPKMLAVDEHVCVAVHRSHNFLQFTTERGSTSGDHNTTPESGITTSGKQNRNKDVLSMWHPSFLNNTICHSQRLHNAFCGSVFEEQKQIVVSSLRNILCSDKTRISILRENNKLRHQLRMVVPNTIRAYKMAKIMPTLCDLETQLQLANEGRIPPTVDAWDEEYAWKLVQEATIPITRLIIFLRTFCSNVPICVRQNTIIVGMVYMLRRGVVVHNVTVLPKISGLCVMLPLEQHLVTVFNIKAKIITEAENVIKFNLRNIPSNVLHLLHVPV